MSGARRTWQSRGPMAIGLGAVILLFAAVALWGAGTQISGAIIGEGKIEVASELTAVQHPVGGVVAEILVVNGDAVQAGDVVLRLDGQDLRSDLAAVEGELYETLANIARIEAVLDDQPRLILPAMLAGAALEDPDRKAMIDRQQRRLDAHFAAVRIESTLIDEQVAQVRDQIAGIEAERAAKVARGALLSEEIAAQRQLAEKGLAVQSTLFNLQKDALLNEGEVGQLSARVAEMQGRIAELRLSAHALLPDLKEKAEEELSRLRPQRTTLIERRSQLLAELDRMEVRAPVSGRIHDSKVQGVQSVVTAASPLMYIVPTDGPLTVGVRIDAADIDQVHPGQAAWLRFTVFGGRRIPDVAGEVASISPDAFVDEATRLTYYEVRIALATDDVAQLGVGELVPGMPVTAFLATESRTPLSYALRPLLFYFDRAFRDS